MRYFVSGVLTWTAGYVDAVGWLTYRHVYTANMSGNSIAVGISASAQRWGEAAFRAWPVLMYVIGLLASRVAIEFAARARVARIASLAFTSEIVLLGLAIAATPAPLAGIALLAIAMGIQNGAITRFGGVTVHTGFVTGTLVGFSEHVSNYLLWLHRHWRNGGIKRSFQQPSFQFSAWMASIWTAYVLGAIGGAIADYRLALTALCVPVLTLAMISAFDAYRPLALEDEREQIRGE